MPIENNKKNRIKTESRSLGHSFVFEVPKFSPITHYGPS